MATDIRLDDHDEQWVTVDANVLNIAGSDLILDSAARRSNQRGFRRALVHSGDDGLIVNFNNDYPNGVTINGTRLNLRVEKRSALSKDGRLGDLVLTHETHMQEVGGRRIPIGESVTLWLCIGPFIGAPTGGARWVPISTGEPVNGV
ncbi:hypothetical protein ABZ917_01380 [Nonomuraea wenchangensis]